MVSLIKKKSISVPKEMQERFEQISKIIKDFCVEKLNQEYEQSCYELCAALCRKRPSPIISGRVNTWACGIIHAIGTVNFVFDSSGKPHIKASELSNWFGISESTGNGKSRQIRNLMKMHQFDRKWTLPSRMDSNPLIWMVEINGFVLDVRYCSREIQEEAYRRGMIPYLPE